MAQKRHETEPPREIPELIELCHKFLYSIAYIENLSEMTCRAYASDLSQAFHFERTRLEIDTKSTPQPVRSGGNGGAAGLGDLSKFKLPSDVLLAHCRRAMTAWSALSPASRNRKSACLKSFLNWLLEKEIIDRDLAVLVHGPKVPHRLPHHLSVDEAIALIHSLERELARANEMSRSRNLAGEESRLEHAKRDLALVLLLYGGGLRVSEAAGLRWANVDLGQRVLRVFGKGSVERLVAVPPMTLLALQRLPRTGPFVFGDEPLPTRLAYQIVRSRGQAAGLLQPLHPHALRHSFATHLLSSGANLRTLQELLGHTTLQATQRYTHIGLDQLARTLEKHHPLGEVALGEAPVLTSALGEAPVLISSLGEAPAGDDGRGSRISKAPRPSRQK